jgi:hypothetical protein
MVEMFFSSIPIHALTQAPLLMFAPVNWGVFNL